jgi:hypothetical protein
MWQVKKERERGLGSAREIGERFQAAQETVRGADGARDLRVVGFPNALSWRAAPNTT